jgi:hypothetical protein
VRVDPETGDLLLFPGEALEAAAAGDHAREDPRVAIALEAVEIATGRLRIVRDGGEARAFVAPGAAAVLLPRPAGAQALRALPPSVLPGALAQLVGLGPRPRPAGEPRRIPAGELADALARPDEQKLLATPVSHWRVERAPRALEVVDSAEGLFMVRADQADAVLSPTTPTRVFRGLVRLLHEY